MLRTRGKDILQGRLPQVRMIKIMVIMITGPCTNYIDHVDNADYDDDDHAHVMPRQ